MCKTHVLDWSRWEPSDLSNINNNRFGLLFLLASVKYYSLVFSFLDNDANHVVWVHLKVMKKWDKCLCNCWFKTALIIICMFFPGCKDRHKNFISSWFFCPLCWFMEKQEAIQTHLWNVAETHNNKLTHLHNNPAAFPDPGRRWRGMARLDWRVCDMHKIMFSWSVMFYIST